MVNNIVNSININNKVKAVLMANYFVRKLPTQYVNVEHLSDNLRIILNDIFILRNSGITALTDIKSDTYEIYYAADLNKHITESIETIVHSFRTAIIKQKKEKRLRSTLILSFYKPIQTDSWFGKKIEKQYYEKWYITYQVFNSIHTDSSPQFKPQNALPVRWFSTSQSPSSDHTNSSPEIDIVKSAKKNFANTQQKEELFTTRLKIQSYGLDGIEAMPTLSTSADIAHMTEGAIMQYAINTMPNIQYTTSFIFGDEEAQSPIVHIQNLLSSIPSLTL